MAETDELLRAMLRRLRDVSRSDSVSLYLPATRSTTARPLLVHDGKPPAVPELADFSSAAEFAREADANPQGPAELSDWLSTRSVRSRGENSFLIRVPSLKSFLAAAPFSEPTEERRSQDQPLESVPSLDGFARNDAWLGFRFDHLPASAQQGSSGEDELFGVPQDQWSAMLAMASALGWHARWEFTALNDPVSALPVRGEFHRILDQILEQNVGPSRPGLIFVNPDDFGIVNERHGRQAGDDVIREIGLRLKQGIRSSDLAFRFGAAVFGVLLPSASADTVGLISEKLHALLGAEPYLNGSVRLGFRLGAAVDEAGGGNALPDRAAELIRRADRALNAARAGTDRQCVVWTEEVESAAVAQYDPLSGIYTANPARDYRNMLLLWDTVGIVGSNDDVDSLLVQVLNRLSATFRVAPMGFFWHGHEGQPGPGLIRRPGDPEAVDRIETPDSILPGVL